MLFNKLSFTHLVAILPISDPLERAFYETMAIRGTWSVRELQRQIDSNYYFRSGWSQKPEALAKLVEGKAETDTLALDIKSPFTFEDLVFYHRILKRHVIIELKANRLNYADYLQVSIQCAFKGTNDRVLA